MNVSCKVYGTKKDAWEITVDINKPVEEYALDFLHIFNNVRAANNVYKIKNYFDSNSVSVWCSNNMKEAMIDYLSQFGEVSEPKKGVIYKIEEPWLNDWDDDNGLENWYEEYPAGQELQTDWW